MANPQNYHTITLTPNHFRLGDQFIFDFGAVGEDVEAILVVAAVRSNGQLVVRTARPGKDSLDGRYQLNAAYRRRQLNRIKRRRR